MYKVKKIEKTLLFTRIFVDYPLSLWNNANIASLLTPYDIYINIKVLQNQYFQILILLIF